MKKSIILMVAPALLCASGLWANEHAMSGDALLGCRIDGENGGNRMTAQRSSNRTIRR